MHHHERRQGRQRVFCDGLHEDILTNLANIAELKVASRTSVRPERDTQVPVRKIVQELGVGSVLEGRVQRAGGPVRRARGRADKRRDKGIPLDGPRSAKPRAQ